MPAAPHHGAAGRFVVPGKPIRPRPSVGDASDSSRQQVVYALLLRPHEQVSIFFKSEPR